MTFTQMLAAAWQKNNSLLCVGLDPDPAKFPAHLKGRDDAIFEFCTAIVDATADLVCAFKPQIAYFAARRAEDQLEALIAHIHEKHPGIPVILDAKRGDIGSHRRAVRQSKPSSASRPMPSRSTPTWAAIRSSPTWPTRTRASSCSAAPRTPAAPTCSFSMSAAKSSTSASPGWPPANGTPAARCAWSSAPPSRPRSPASVKSSATCRCWCRASAPRAATSRPRSGPAAPPTATGLMINSSRAILYAGKDEDFAAAARQAALETRDAINLYR